MGQIYHARLRTNCSSLNHHLFTKNIIDSPLCTCGSIEDTHHFLFSCNRFTNLRVELFEKIVPICTPTLGALLFGNCELSSEENKQIELALNQRKSNVVTLNLRGFNVGSALCARWAHCFPSAMEAAQSGRNFITIANYLFYVWNSSWTAYGL